jgi:hypothetical protein
VLAIERSNIPPQALTVAEKLRLLVQAEQGLLS